LLSEDKRREKLPRKPLKIAQWWKLSRGEEEASNRRDTERRWGLK